MRRGSRTSRPAARRRLTGAIAALAAVSAVLGTSAGTAGGAVALNGAPVSVVATNIPVPTAFAWDGSTMFAGEGPVGSKGTAGGLFLIANGSATIVPDSPKFVFGLAWHEGRLFVSTGPTIEVMSGWNGTAFAAVKTIWKGPPQFYRFNGIAFGPDGRLYAGLGLKEPKYDHTVDPYWLSQAVVSMTTAGKDLQIVASGIRQPFQLYFPPGSRYPYVTDLGQDEGTIPPDEILVAKPGEDYGFPNCTWLVLSKCRYFQRPLILLPKHASPMGISGVGRTLYVALFTGIGNNDFNPEVVTIPVGGGKPTPFMTGFEVQIIALNIHAGDLYVGTLNGVIFEVPVAAAPSGATS
jgi:hypothetical protein